MLSAAARKSPSLITDWLVVRRAGAEFDRALRGARVTDVGRLDDGRFAIRFGGRRDAVLAVDPFGTPPLATLETEEPALGGDPSYARAIATALRGMRLAAVRGRPGDRVLALEFEALSRFGVGSRATLVLELIPRFGNVVLVHDRLVSAAAKLFGPAENGSRTIDIGVPYEPPPLPQATLPVAALAAAMAAGRRGRVSAVGRALPLLPRLLAESLVLEGERAGHDGAALAAWIVERAPAILADCERRASAESALVVYRDGGRLVQVHLLPLVQFEEHERSDAPQLLPLFSEAVGAERAERGSGELERRRHALAARIERRAAALAAEREGLQTRLADAGSRDRLRASGDALHTYGHLVPKGASSFAPPDDPGFAIPLDPELDAKANAARYFAQYRKAAAALPHLERRRDGLSRVTASLEELAWGLERAQTTAALDEIAADLEAIEGRPPPRERTAGHRREILRVVLPSGARIVVGRSPRENAEVTFRIARPDDLWFHARAVPGAHVVLQPPAGREADEHDLQTAADLAARYSRGASAGRVTIDYVARKYVRKQRDAAPGLVWYTNAKSIVGRAAVEGSEAIPPPAARA